MEPTDACPSRDDLHTCPLRLRLVLDQIADKWSILILATLCSGPARFNVIRRNLNGITHKALSQALRRLERNGIVSRRVIATKPIAVEYAVTELGASLKAPITALYAWSAEHEAEVHRAQENFDARQSAGRESDAATPAVFEEAA